MKNSNYLHELNPSDRKFMEHKFDSVKVAKLLLDAGFNKESNRLINCANNLSFRILNNNTYKLYQTHTYTSSNKKIPLIQFCKIRYCPMCQWRHSKLWKHKFLVAIPKILEDFPGYKFLFLTLTVSSPPLSQMRATLDKMKNSFKKMSTVYEKDGKRSRGNKIWPAIGQVRFTEVTRGNVPGCCHPHFHCLLLVPKSYFYKDNYLTAQKWGEMWQKYMKLNYTPSVTINVVEENYTTIIPEIVKYACKNNDLLDLEFLSAYKKQMRYYHLIEISGVLSKYIQHSEMEDEDLIQYAGQEDYENSNDIIFFRWKQTNIQLLEGNYRWDYQLVN